MGVTKTAALAIAEWREFASFSAEERSYIERALDIGLARRDVLARSLPSAKPGVRRHYLAYQRIKVLRDGIPDSTDADIDSACLSNLIAMAQFDLAQAQLSHFAAFRFLYERLLGAGMRPWLPSIFCAAAALPSIPPQRRKQLLQSLSEAAATAPGWSDTPPRFFPETLTKDAA